MSDPAAVCRRLDAAFPATVARLVELVRIPSCSFPGFPVVEVERSAQGTAAWLRGIGMPEVEVVAGTGPFPAVIARDHRAGPRAPTVLLYAHHDTQPPGDPAGWTTPAWEPAQRDGRLYGRGSADDKAGIACIAAACGAWLAEGGLPLNVTILVEGEEEIGSPHLDPLLTAHLDRLRADAILIADVGNVATGIPSLTVSLRGMIAIEVRLRCGSQPLHSGMWGGPTPDPVTALCRMIAGLTDAEGRFAIPGVAIPEPDPAALADLAAVPHDGEKLRNDGGFAAGFAAALRDGPTVYRRMWYEPTVTVTGIRAGDGPGRSGNVLNPEAWARLSIRLVAGMEPQQVVDATKARLRALSPPGAELELTGEGGARAWRMDCSHPAHAAAKAAFKEGYGCDVVAVGCGGSIPLVDTLTSRLGQIPALLLPVEDQLSNAHGRNESVHLGDLQASSRSLALLLARLAERGVLRSK